MDPYSSDDEPPRVQPSHMGVVESSEEEVEQDFTSRKKDVRMASEAEESKEPNDGSTAGHKVPDPHGDVSMARESPYKNKRHLRPTVLQVAEYEDTA